MYNNCKLRYSVDYQDLESYPMSTIDNIEFDNKQDLDNFLLDNGVNVVRVNISNVN